jgi:hypothetical protein
MKIAIIDSGINQDHPHVGNVAGGIFITPGGESEDYLDRLGHGTAVAGAVHEKAPHAELYAVKVFDRRLRTEFDVIIRAIEWSIRKRVDIINLSLGTQNSSHRERFEAVLATGSIVVSAFEHNGQMLLPGALDSVIGVTLDADCPRDVYRVEMRGRRPVFCCSGYPRSIPGVPPSGNLNGISFAVANMTGFVARALAAGATPVLLETTLMGCAAERTR